jgi:aromatic ring-opening dioxygenase catalytic subunit (LigB family)
MTISFACAVGHAPGITAWRDAAPRAQQDSIYSGFDRLRGAFAESRSDAVVLFTSEHWANFFLNHVSPFCIGRAGTFTGPVEPWLKIEKQVVKGDPALANELIAACYDSDFDPSFSDELEFDHGTMLPLHFIVPGLSLPVVPIFINTLAPPQPSGRRCLELGRVVGEALRKSKRRVAIIATGGMSHDPGEKNHGIIDSTFDRRFLDTMAKADLRTLGNFGVGDLAAAGAGAIELLDWIALAGALQRYAGEVVAYEPVVPWATGIGMMSFSGYQPGPSA